MFRIKNQYVEITGDNGLLSDYNAMLFWFKTKRIEALIDLDVDDVLTLSLLTYGLVFVNP